MNRLSAPSNDKWRPQDCASDIQLTRPPPPPFPTPRRLLASFPIPLTTSGAGPHPGPGMDSTPAWIGREAASVCLLLTFNQQSPNYCSARVRTSDVIAIFPLFSRSAVHTVLGEEEDHGQSGFKRSTWTRIFVFLNWYVLYYIIRKLFMELCMET